MHHNYNKSLDLPINTFSHPAYCSQTITDDGTENPEQREQSQDNGTFLFVIETTKGSDEMFVL